MPSATPNSSPPDAAGQWETALPVIRIGSGPEPLLDRLHEFWRYREVLYFLAWRDVRVRYRQTLLGIAWAVLQPLLTMLLFTIFFGKLAGMPSDGIPYALFAYTGLLPWTFFANAVTNSGESLVANPTLVGKVYLPQMLVPSAAVAATLVDFAIAFGLLVGLLAYYRVAVFRDRDDVADLLRGTSMLVNCSAVPESFGLAVLEAMALAIPVIVPKASAFPEYVTDLETGLLYAPGDLEELAACILRLLRDPPLARKIGLAGRALVESRFTAEHMVSAMEEQYRQLLAGQSEPRPETT